MLPPSVVHQAVLSSHENSVFLGSIFVFELGSLICGIAPNSPTLIAGRAIAGVGSAGIFTGAMMVMIPMVPLHKRPMFQGEAKLSLLRNNYAEIFLQEYSEWCLDLPPSSAR